MSRYIFSLVLAICICSGCTSDLENQMKKFSGSRVAFDITLTRYFGDSLDMQYRMTADSTIKFVVLYDSTECSSCRVNTLGQYEDIRALSNERGEKVTPIIIFSPAMGQTGELKKELRLHELSFPIYIDSCRNFNKINTQIPVDRRLHAFLLNRNNEVVLIGNPVNNPQLWTLYEDTVKTL